jgi:long-chain acyl-CoA synthetase
MTTATREVLADIVRTHAHERGASPMISYGDRVITWAEMDERSSRVAQGLLAEGVRPQERVAVLDKNGPEFFEILFGGSKMNAVNVAVNWRLAPREMEFVINDAEARVLFVGPDFFPHLDEFEGELGTVTKVIALGEHPRHEGYERWLSRQGTGDPRATAAPDDVAMQIYTSGTTGLPKGAMLTNQNFARLPDLASRWGLNPASVNVVAMPLFHIGGSGWAICGMHQGCHSLLYREFIPQEILTALSEKRATNALLVPAMLQVLSAQPDAAGRDYSSLRAIMYGASPITTEVLVRSMGVFKCDFVQLYGLTETTGTATQLDAADHDPDGPRAFLLRSAGKAQPWVELRIVDPVSGADQPEGQVGEVWIRSSQVMKGYWNKSDETSEAITPDGWFKTGDAGYVDAEGFLFLTDRIKDMIVSGGENIYPIEVENVLAGHPQIADVAVIGVPDARWGETVKAIVVPKSGAAPQPEEVIAFTRERLARYKCPTSVDFVAELPRNPSGKILKRQLRETYWSGQERRIN